MNDKLRKVEDRDKSPHENSQNDGYACKWYWKAIMEASGIILETWVSTCKGGNRKVNSGNGESAVDYPGKVGDK